MLPAFTSTNLKGRRITDRYMMLYGNQELCLPLSIRARQLVRDFEVQILITSHSILTTPPQSRAPFPILQMGAICRLG